MLHVSVPSLTTAAYLFVQTLQLHLQGLQETLSLSQLTLGCSQSFIALLHLVLDRLQLDRKTDKRFQWICWLKKIFLSWQKTFLTFLWYHCSACSLFFLTMPSYWVRRSDRMDPSSGPLAESTSTFTSSLAIRDFICSSSYKRRGMLLFTMCVNLT